MVEYAGQGESGQGVSGMAVALHGNEAFARVPVSLRIAAVEITSAPIFAMALFKDYPWQQGVGNHLRPRFPTEITSVPVFVLAFY